METLETTTWIVDWAVSLPLILITVIVHVFGLAFINDTTVLILKDVSARRRFMHKFALVMLVAVFMMIALHGLEAVAWGLVYRMLGLFESSRSAVLYSLGAMTGFGAGSLSLPPNWLMAGVLQSLAGLLLFGLTTAFMFGMIQAVWPVRTRAQMGRWNDAGACP